jgi:hypothetical protein
MWELGKVRVCKRSWQKVDFEERVLAVFSLLNFGEYIRVGGQIRLPRSASSDITVTHYSQAASTDRSPVPDASSF